MIETKDVRCLYCDALITEEIVTVWDTYRHGVRTDKFFCNERCKGNYHYHNEAPHIHADLERNIILDCVECGGVFRINQYADRTGRRLPLYCSNACKQRAYRKRKREAGADKEVSNGSIWMCETKDCGQRRFTEPMGDKCDYCDQSNWIAL